jgi:shikimate dehydrogenase
MIRGTTRIAAVLGWPVAHSRSPELLNAAFSACAIDAAMIALAVPPHAFASAVEVLAACGALGASVTAPHKLAAAACCAELSSDAAAIGAVNCIAFVDGRAIGHNTDSAGFVDGLAVAGFALAQRRRVVVLGGGGAARAVAHGLRAHDVAVLARTELDWTARVPWTAHELAEQFARADLVVDCTATSHDEADFVAGLPLETLPSTAWVASLTYYREPLLLVHAAARNLRTVDGTLMLAHQGARAFTIWTNLRAPLDAMIEALLASLKRP